MKNKSLFVLLFCLAGFISCQQGPQSSQAFSAYQDELRYSGRIDTSNPEEVVLIGSASSVEFAFSGDSVQVLLRKLNPEGEPNYVTFELDGEYLERIRLEHDSMSYYTIPLPSAGPHVLKVVKATEAQNGDVAFGGFKVKELQALPPAPERTIEFIGNSITCGMGVDYDELPCDSGLWYDQHNASLAYGPRVAKALDARFMLNCVSGIGVYRNWNSAQGEEPVMPDVYENRDLDANEQVRWDFARFQPDLVSIALGTNDFSEGDGVKERLPFDSAQFVTSYIDFVHTIYKKYPNTQVTLLTSPMVSGEKGALFLNSLRAVQQHFKQKQPDKKPIAIYNFESIVPHGCGYHPDKEDHKQMSEQLVPFYREVMGWDNKGEESVAH